jgi:phenylacetate-CoA ligase
VIFEPDFECLPPDAMRALQDQRLRDLVAYVDRHVPLYRERLAAARVKPADLRGVADLTALPITRKADLRDTYPFGLLAVPRSTLRRVHGSSGTTGKPTIVAYTADDLDLFARVTARSLAMAGAEPGMMLHNAYGYGLFTGGLGLHGGAERLGLNVVPVSSGMTERQLTLLQDLQPELLSCTPSYALTLASAFAAHGVSPTDISLRYSLHGAEPWTDAVRAEIDATLGVRCSNIYGLSEIIGPGVSCECVEARDGSHIMEDHFYPEILDPDTGAPLPDGAEGVLVLTTLTKEALPLLRYWTGDITSLVRGPCACGRTLVRMRMIHGRTDDMLIIRGVNVYPSQIEGVVTRIAGLSPHFRLVVTRAHHHDHLAVHCEVTPAWARAQDFGIFVAAEHQEHEAALILRRQIAHRLHDVLGVSVTVHLLAVGEGPRSEGGKLQRVVDRRAEP